MPIFYPQVTHQIGGNTAGATANISSGTYVLAGGNNITLSQNANSVTISAGAGGGGLQSAGISTQGNTAGTTGFASQSIQFVGGNNITLSQTLAGGGATLTIVGPSPSAAAVTLGVSTGGNTSGDTGTVNAQLVLAGSNNITLSQSTNGQSATVTISGPDALSVGISNLGNTAGTTGLFTERYVLVGGDNVTLSQATTTGGSATLSIAAGGTLGYWQPFDGAVTASQFPGNGTIAMYPIYAQERIVGQRVHLLNTMTVSTSSNSSHAGVISLAVGLYTLNGSTLSAGTTGSTNYQWTNTSNNSTSVLSGARLMALTMNYTMTPGHYWLGVWSRTSATNANWFTASNIFLANNVAFNYSGEMLVATNNTHQVMPGMGLYSASTTTLVNSIGISELRGIGANNNWRLRPWIAFNSTTF